MLSNQQLSHPHPCPASPGTYLRDDMRGHRSWSAERDAHSSRTLYKYHRAAAVGEPNSSMNSLCWTRGHSDRGMQWSHDAVPSDDCCCVSNELTFILRLLDLHMRHMNVVKLHWSMWRWLAVWLCSVVDALPSQVHQAIVALMLNSIHKHSDDASNVAPVEPILRRLEPNGERWHLPYLNNYTTAQHNSIGWLVYAEPL